MRKSLVLLCLVGVFGWSSGAYATPYSSAVLADNPVSYWRLGDSGSLGVDEVGGRNLTYEGSPIPGQPGAIAGDPNTATGFSGDRSALTLGYDPALNSNTFSIEAWVNVSGNCDDPNECHQNFVTSRYTFWKGYYLHLFSNPSTSVVSWNFTVGRPGGWGGVSYSDGSLLQDVQGSWHHLLGTYDGTHARFYLNGLEIGSMEQNFVPNSAYEFSIGTGTDFGNRYPTTGQIDEVAYYDYALGADRVENHYLTGIGVIPEPNTALLLGLGLVGLGIKTRRRRPRGAVRFSRVRKRPERQNTIFLPQ